MKLNRNIWLELIKGVDAILLTVPFAITWYTYYAEGIIAPYYRRGNWLVIAIFFVLYSVFGRVYDAFSVSLNRISEMVYSQGLSALFADLLMYMIIWLLAKHLPNPIPLILTFASQLFLSTVWVMIAKYSYFHMFPRKKTIVVHDQRAELASQLREAWLGIKFDVQKNVSVDECLKDLGSFDELDTVFLSGIHSHERNIILKHCIENNIEVYVIPRVGDVLMSGAERIHMLHLPILKVKRYSPSVKYLILKRSLDIIISLMSIIILAPVFLITSLAITITDRGPVFYKQSRLTKDGKVFNVIKFRSMRVDAEKDGVARLSSGDNDTRITPIGRFIRKVRIDELPQLFNILIGDMTLVGPRPERPEIAKEYEQILPEFRLRLQCKAGLTGYAQVYGKYSTTPYDKLLLDLMYITNPSLIEDLRIMLATVKILFMPESTEGIAAGQTTALRENGKGKS